jgi:EmrB/QacA subfamily drug resistance transporter
MTDGKQLQTQGEEILRPEKKQRLGWIMAIYLLGLFIGALSTSIITPARTIIQSSLGVDDQNGIWMITIFTLSYAAIIPVAGKLADRYGRKKIFMTSIALFALGTILCGMSDGLDSFAVLLAGRTVQAIGAGGIMPIATAEFGTSFPEEKRGMALGLVGGIYGIANVLAATAGSAILDIFGTDQWQWIFYINLPFCAAILIGGLLILPDHKGEVVGRIDKFGTLLLTVIILSLLYGLKNIDFFDFFPSLLQPDVYPFLLAELILIPLFVFVEKRAEDPIFHIEYLRNRQIVIVLAMSTLVGASMMGMIFIPQFAENSLKIPTGNGGYFVIILGFVAGLISPVSGWIIDKFGAKVVLGAGFVISIIGCAYLVWIAAPYPGAFNVVVSLMLIGAGMGLSMGTPLNYMMMGNTRQEESNAALATLSLMRSIGTAVAPAIMVGFLMQAGMTMQPNLMAALPDIPSTPVLEEQAELNEVLGKLKDANPKYADMLDNASMDLPDGGMALDEMGIGGSLPDDVLKSLTTADVTNIVKRTQDMATYMFNQSTPPVIADIQGGIDQGIQGINEGIDGVDSGISSIKSAMAELENQIEDMNAAIQGMESGIAGMTASIMQMQQAIDMAESGMPPVTPGMPPATMGMPVLGNDTAEMPPMPGGEGGLTPAQQLEQLKAAKATVETQLAQLMAKKSKLESAVAQMTTADHQMSIGLADAQEQRVLMVRAVSLMTTIRDKVPELFAQSQAQYLADIQGEAPAIEKVFQTTINDGFANLYVCVMVFNIVGFAILLLYRDPIRDPKRRN